ncbi:adenosylmethionine--8-amino-7-oxononanoate transaminase [Longimicrobium sp.]|uniref:adenosylmethionine--8-amino-7-oxononanoate transaminase n=1 Tax=Longimicrobium sp. TaxID=2029185 RepID=UPI002BD8E6E0|nr:adenosylmethionine--8-amino-7-oxononanoate transaminase [Longimicrobium sp.]HSU14272.1 adenosylmethionine--8-amino-7-oxononanoate transaminase [Longimicrobium sp.]
MSPDWLALDTAHVWHPYTQHGIAPTATPVVGGEGAYLHLADGTRLLDAISSWWVTLHGHAHPAIAAAIAEQARVLEQVIFAGFAHEPGARLAAELAAVLPAGLTRVFYSDDGSTAVEVAVKMALQHWRLRGQRRPLVAALEHAYHGDTFGAMSASGRSVFTEAFEDHLFETARLPDPTEGDTVAALDRLLDERGNELAAVIVEPLLLAAGGMRVWSEDTLRAIRQRTADAGVLLIADEVATGFGRTGPLWACDRAGISPDLMCLSKGVTGGFMPLGVTAAREEIFQAFVSGDRRHTFFHGHSFTGNPLACAAARASLHLLLDDGCTARRGEIERAHRGALDALASHPRVRAPRVLGTVAAFETEAGGAGYLEPVGRELAAYARGEGVLLRPLGNTVYLMPPYCATASEVHNVYRVIGRFLETR